MIQPLWCVAWGHAGVAWRVADVLGPGRSFDSLACMLQYLLDEIADIARQTPESAQAIADAVQKKLGVKSPVVKFKVMRQSPASHRLRTVQSISHYVCLICRLSGSSSTYVQRVALSSSGVCNVTLLL